MGIYDELKKSQEARLKAWQYLQEIRAFIVTEAREPIPPPPAKTFDAEGPLVAAGVRRSIWKRQRALADLLHAIRRFQRSQEGSEDYGPALHALNQAIEYVDRLID